MARNSNSARRNWKISGSTWGVIVEDSMEYISCVYQNYEFTWSIWFTWYLWLFFESHRVFWKNIGQRKTIREDENDFLSFLGWQLGEPYIRNRNDRFKVYSWYDEFDDRFGNFSSRLRVGSEFFRLENRTLDFECRKTNNSCFPNIRYRNFSYSRIHTTFKRFDCQVMALLLIYNYISIISQRTFRRDFFSKLMK